MGSTAKSQKQQQSQCLRVSRNIHVLTADISLILISRDVVLVSVFIFVFVKTTKLGHLLKSSLEKMLSAQMGFLVSVQMKSH